MNFDSTIVGKPYSRIENIVIDYTAPTVGTDVPEMISVVCDDELRQQPLPPN